jgi:DNA helicase-2/ATP-dependent DNA helicase PcrA
VGTVEFFPEEGKYHEDGHRKCNICLTSQESIKLQGLCPVCHKPLTIGVMHRVNELADRQAKNLTPPPTAGKFFSLVPLPEILSEVMQIGTSSKSVANAYENLIHKLGPELAILREVPISDVSKVHSPLLAEAISRLRKNQVIKQAGFDGEYGVIKLFEARELVKNNYFNLALDLEPPVKQTVNPASLPKEPQVSYVIQKKSFEARVENKGLLSGLDEQQLMAVQNLSSQLLIVAGPGSGKTAVLTKRIAYSILERKVAPQNCLAITFTRRASKEMHDRLNLLLPNNCAALNIHTFHSLCFSILKANFAQAGLSSEFRIASRQEMDLALEQFKSNSVLAFDDLIVLTVKLLNERPALAQTYQERFKYISVDEYQDIDSKQYELIRLLAPIDGELCVIGDPNQAIYGFRGGDSKFFKSFTQDYPAARVINLKNNYRSTKTIVNASNQIINSYNIVATNEQPHQKIIIHSAATDKAEAEFVTSKIENLIGGHSFFSLDTNRSAGEECNLSFSDFAVLYRTTSQLEPLCEAFQRSGMPFIALSNALVCDKKEVRELLSQLTDAKPLLEQLERLVVKFNEKIDQHILKYLFRLAQTHSERNEFIHEASLLSEIDTLDQRANRISLLTLHSSKGLEFKCVFIVGLEDGIIPLYRAQEVNEVEEERRLLYVGMTRAEQSLFLTHAVKRRWRGTYRNLEPSRFLEKIEKELLSFSKFEKPPQEKKEFQQLKLF